MGQSQVATKIDSRVKQALEDFCRERGLKINRFIEDAILDKLEEVDDISELRWLRKEEFVPFASVIEELKKHGKI